MAESNKILTDAAREKLKIGELVDTRQFTINDKWLKEYALALRETNPLLWDDDFAAREGRFGFRVAPSAFCVVLNPMERGLCPASDFWGELFGKPGKHWGGHAAFNTFECYKPIRLGDQLTCEVRNVDCFEKQGKRGVLVVAETEYKLINQDGETVTRCTYGNMVQFPDPEPTDN